ncbi:MAG: M28 family peptidase, partial [Halomonadaceae bacterium]
YLTNIEWVLEALMDAGAAGFVGVLADYFDSNRYYNEFYRRLPFTLPGVWVGPREGARIRELLGENQAATATLTLEGSRTETTARVVHGFIPGTSNDTIQVQSHHDAVWQGGVQDASGVAALLALAHYYAGQGPGEREKTLMFSSFSSHWTGYQLHQDFVGKYLEDNQTDYNLVANVTIEHIGRHGVINRDSLELQVSEQPEPRGILNNVSLDLNRSIAEAIKRHDLHRTALMGTEDIGMPTDASFVYQAGLPTISLISGPVYLYDEMDTPDLVAQDQLQPVARVFIDIIEALDATPPGDMARGDTMDEYQFGEFDEEMSGQRGAVISELPEDLILQLLQ